MPDSTPVVDMWDALGDVSFESTSTKSDDADDKSNVRDLEGALIVRIKHVTKELASVSLKKLTLRSHDNGATWSVDDTEVKRIRGAATE